MSKSSDFLHEVGRMWNSIEQRKDILNEIIEVLESSDFIDIELKDYHWKFISDAMYLISTHLNVKQIMKEKDKWNEGGIKELKDKE